MVLVLGNDDSVRAAMDAINQVLFQRASELVLRKPNSWSRRSWFFLDEVREAGKLAGLPRLMNKGRSKGVCVALGFQDIHGMKSVYGAELALELVGQCSNKVLLRLESAETAKWASETVGQYEEIQVLESQSRDSAAHARANDTERAASDARPRDAE
jgi:type IV secretory pathway TraG/TraD family ATPase VirD4